MTLPDFSFEKRLHKQGYKLIAGVDEVGRGCFAGPVVAGAVIFGKRVRPLGSPKALPPTNKLGAPSLGPPASRHPFVVINDSKKLSQKQREVADKWIRKNALAYGIASASVAQINKLGIKKATEIAFRKAISQARPDYLLIDAFYIPYVKGLRRRNQKAIVKGDSLSFSIAAASIIAKVYRDKLMSGLAKKSEFKNYNWAKNKGYGTKEHQKMILKYGTTKLHRIQFVNTWRSKV